MAIRYSGDCRITITIIDLGGLAAPVTYRVTASWIENEGTAWQRRRRESVRIAHTLEHGSGRGADHPETYDRVARSGLSFLDEDGANIPCAWDADGDGPWVQRRPVLGRELAREYAKKLGR